MRQGDGVAGVHGSAGEFTWAGYAGTYFWVDPKEEIVGVYMTQAPSPIRSYYRKMFKSLVYQALVDWKLMRQSQLARAGLRKGCGVRPDGPVLAADHPRPRGEDHARRALENADHACPGSVSRVSRCVADQVLRRAVQPGSKTLLDCCA